MKGKFILFKRLISYTAILILGIFIISCSKKNESENIPAPSEKKVPEKTAECVPADISALRTIAKANPEAHLFEGEEPSHWKGVEINWTKNESGKFAVVRLSITEEKSSLTLNLEGGKEGNALFGSMESLEITSAGLKKATIANQPLLKKILLNGKGKAKADTLNISGTKSLKEINVEGFPELVAFEIGGEEIDKLVIADLPKLKDQHNLKFRRKYDKEGKPVKTTSVKEFILKGELNSLEGIYLPDMGIEKFSVETSLPALTSVALYDNKLTGVLELKGLSSLNTLFLSNNRLTEVKLSECPQMTELDLSKNPDLTRYAFSLPALKIMDLNETGLMSLDISMLGNLKKLSAYGSKLVSVIFSADNIKKLTALNLSGNRLTGIDFKNQESKIFLLTLDNNRIKSLDLSRMPSLERLLANDNKLEKLDVSAGAAGFSKLECRNNHLTVKILKDIKEKLTELEKWEIAPQYVLGRVNTEKKQIDAKEEAVTLGLKTRVEKYDGKKWNEVSGEYSVADGIHSFNGKGKYRVICTSFLDFKDWYFDIFSLDLPYVIGELEIR